MRRWVLHIDMDSFYASCEQLTRPTLRGRPVLVGGTSGRGVVAGASYEARALGARSAMPMFQARPLIGYRGVVVTPRKPLYSVVSQRVFALVAREAGVVEQLSIDEAYLEPAEIQGAEADVVREWAERLRARIREETGLAASVGAGPGKQYAKIGSGRAKPDGVHVVEDLSELDPLPVGELWGIGRVSEAKLAAYGVTTIGEFAALSEREVTAILGQAVGGELWQIARGNDPRPVHPRAEAKQISSEHTYPFDLTTVAEVNAAIERAGREAHRRLLRDGRGARTVTVKLRLSSFAIESRSLTLPYATDEWDTLFATALRLARYPEDVGNIRLVGVSLSGLEEARQNILFPELDRHAPSRTAPDTDFEAGVRADGLAPEIETHTIGGSDEGWKATQDVFHPDYGHGWIQGAGFGVVTVRFETRASGPGRTRTLRADDPLLVPADPLDSLDWPDWLAQWRDVTGETPAAAETPTRTADTSVPAPGTKHPRS